MKKAIMISIQPKYAEKIFSGEKTVELRRVSPKVEPGTLAIVYVSSPVKAVLGAFRISEVIQLPVNELWNRVKDKAGVSELEFWTYYKGKKVGAVIYFDDVWQLDNPIRLSNIRDMWKDFRPPQSYRYVSSSIIKTGIEYLDSVRYKD